MIKMNDYKNFFYNLPVIKDPFKLEMEYQRDIYYLRVKRNELRDFIELHHLLTCASCATKSRNSQILTSPLLFTVNYVIGTVNN